MSVHAAKLVEDGETYWFASTDETGPDHFLPVNQQAHDEHEAEVARLFDVQDTKDGGILYMRIHRDYLSEKGATFLS